MSAPGPSHGCDAGLNPLPIREELDPDHPDSPWSAAQDQPEVPDSSVEGVKARAGPAWDHHPDRPVSPGLELVVPVAVAQV